MMPQLTNEAKLLDASLSVSSTLQLSSDALQASYHRWINRMPAVRWFPCLGMLFHLGLHLQLARKGEGSGCGLLHQAILAPCTCLMALNIGHTLMDPHEAAKSMLNIWSPVSCFLPFISLVVCGDACFASVVLDDPLFLDSLPKLAILTVFVAAMGYVQFPIPMIHLPISIRMTVYCHTTLIYMQYLQLKGGIARSSDPKLHGLLTILAGSGAASLLVFTVRVVQTRAFTLAFLKSASAAIRQHSD